MVTIPKIITDVFANILAPIKHVNRIPTFIIVQYKNRHHRPSGITTLSELKYPPGPKFSINPSTHPVTYSALLTILAKKKSVPIDPPKSGPSVRLIITITNKKEHKQLCNRYDLICVIHLQYTPPPSTAPFVEIAHTEDTVNNNIM